MFVQNILIIALAAMVIVLMVLLLNRIRREKTRYQTINDINPDEYSEFLKSNSIDGTIQIVASKLSKFLIDVFHCNGIIFLRKKRSLLELNYYYRINNFNRNDFKFQFTQMLADRLREDIFPRNISVLEDIIPEKALDKIKEYKLDIFFPVFWRENLYGIYFINTPLETGSSVFRIIISFLSQSLSAAYHIKWHESKLSGLQKQMFEKRTPDTEDGGIENEPVMANGLLKLVNTRNSDSLIPKIISSLKDDLGFSKVAYYYQHKSDKGYPLVFKEGINDSLSAPEMDLFREIETALKNRQIIKVDEIAAKIKPLEQWASNLKEKGLNYCSAFPLSDNRSGFLLWESDAPGYEFIRKIQAINRDAIDLVNNAETYEAVEELSFTDNLTGLANQRYFFKRIFEEVSRAERYHRNLALIFFDLDEMKNINDVYGHQAGDEALKKLGDMIKKSIRAIDIIARYGGDEFCIIMPEVDELMCSQFMSRLQKKVAAMEIGYSGSDRKIKTTISLGGAVFPMHADDPKGLIYAADMSLLKAKESGRNKYLLYTGDKIDKVN